MSFTLKRNNFKDEQLRVHVEEISAWLPRVLHPEAEAERRDAAEADEAEEDGRASPAGPAVDVDQFFEGLSDGIDLCRLIERVSPASSWPPGADGPEADVKCAFNGKAKPGSFQARDNVSKFLDACKELGLREVTLFTTEDLMSRKNDARVMGVLLDLARLGAENGLVAPQIVEYERELDAHESDSEDEEVEVFVPEQFGLVRAELDAVLRVFEAATEDDAAVTTRPGFAATLEADGEVARLREARPEFNRLFTNATRSADEGAVALDEWLNWFKKPNKPDETGDAPEPAPIAAVRPRGSSLSQRKYTFLHLPYLPHKGDAIDAELAEIVNSNQLDIRIRRIAVKSKKRGKNLEGAYRIGSGSQPKVFMRLVRGLLMVRVGNKWESVVRHVQRKMAEEYA